MNLSNGTRSEMINELKKSTCRVIFTKVNGDERNMVCTLDESIIPAPVVAAENRGTMIKEIQKGFMMKDRLLRPSLVGVSKKTENIEEKSEENKENSDNQ